MTLGNYGWVETANLKTPLFIVAYSTVLIEHKIFDPKKETTKVAVLKLWLVYYIFSIQMYFLFIRQILQSELRVEDNKSGSNFYNKSGNAILLATSNLWNNIQIVRTWILKYNISNSVNFVTRYLDFETLYNCFGYVFDEIIHHIFVNVEDVKKIYFPTQKCIYYSCTF